MESMENPTPSQKGERPPKQDEYASSTHKGKFRFKSSSSRSRHASDRPSKRKTHSPSRTKEPSRKKRPSHRSTQSHIQPNLNTPPRALSPGAAFRESLFDAMGDDEGAAYWEAIYGQPIHNYAVPEVEGPNGELEQMDEEEYAAYVRARMWERTREGMLEEQERYREERRRQKAREADGRTRDRERMEFDRAMEESLRRGAERKARRRWEGVWETYLSRWAEIAKIVSPAEAADAGAEAEPGSKPASQPLRNLLFWPVQSGKRRDVTPEAVREFLKHAPAETDLSVILKAERVRWHPDKIQHRYSGLGIDDVVLRSVTEVFQIIDQMWSEQRERKT